METGYGKPLCDAELKHLQEVFQGLSTFNPENGGSIPASEIPKLVDAMNYPGTDAQKQAYVAYWTEHYGGILTKAMYMEIVQIIHSTALVSRKHALEFDKNGDGFIDAEEFEQLLKMLGEHDPRLHGKTFEDFILEADMDRDGKVGIEECVNWIHGYCSSRCGTPTPF